MKPLAMRLRPKSLEEVLGQSHILAKGAPFRLALDKKNVPSTIFWGPPGCGKTTLAQIMASYTQRPFFQLSAVHDGMAVLKKYILARYLERYLVKSVRV